MTLALSTPALLFPAISLLLLAYTNRFLVVAQLIRQLRSSSGTTPKDSILRQIRSLRKRMLLMKAMQVLGVSSFILCSTSMWFLFHGGPLVGEWTFGGSLLSLIASLLLSLWEIMISTDAIEVEIQDLPQ